MLTGGEHGALTHDTERLAPARQGRDLLIDAVKRNDGASALLDPPVALVHGFERGHGVPIERREVVEQVLVVALDGQHVVCALVEDQADGFGATV